MPHQALGQEVAPTGQKEALFPQEALFWRESLTPQDAVSEALHQALSQEEDPTG